MITTLKLNIKCTDNCDIKLLDNNNNVILEHTGYVPDFFPEDHYGDYLFLDIDIATGRILNWEKVTDTDLTKFINDVKED